MTGSDHPAEPTTAAPGIAAGPSFIRLVYSFSVATDALSADVPARVQTIFDHVKAQAPEQGWRDRKILYEYVLPHLADHMNAPEARSANEVGHWWERTNPDSVPKRWTLHGPKGRTIELDLNNIELLLFRSTGIGMLIFDVDARSDRLDDWQDALNLIRFYRLPEPTSGVVDERDQTRHGVVFVRRAQRIRPTGPPELDLVDDTPYGFGQLIAHLLDPLIPDREWERPSVPGLMTPYSAFFATWPETATEEEKFDALYRWRRQLTSKAPVAATSHDDLNAWLMPYADHMWFAYSVEGGGFFGSDVPDHDFFGATLPDHLRRPYGFGFLLALHQRLALSRFSERIGDAVAEAESNGTSLPERETIALLQDDFLRFLTRYRFVQVLRTTNHHASYQQWEQAFQVADFASEVEQELRSLFERAVVETQIADAARSERVARRVNLVGLGFALPTIVLAVLAVGVPAGVPLTIATVIAAASIVAGIAIGRLLDQRRPLGRTSDRPPGRDRDGDLRR